MIVDDEPLAHEVILHHLENRKNVTIIKQCYQAAEALSWLASNSVDLILLDINMPHLTGMEMIRVMADPPQVIIVSAYQEYALEGFELNVTDYLLKPVTAERLDKAIEKVVQRGKQPQLPSKVEESVFLKVDRGLKKFKLSEITILEAYGNYVKLWQDENHILISSTLKQLYQQLPEQNFTQVHKSFVVNNQSITEFNTNALVLDNGRTIAVGHSFKKSTALIKVKLQKSEMVGNT